MTVRDLEVEIAGLSDVAIAVRLHPADFDALWVACALAEGVETTEERERREAREAALGAAAALPPISSIPLFVDPTVTRGKPRVVLRSEKFEHERWLESRR